MTGLISMAVLAMSAIIGILLGDTLNFAALGRIGPGQAGAIFALNAPMAAILGWFPLGETLELAAITAIASTATGVALAPLA